MQHLPSDDIGKLLDAYRRLDGLDFSLVEHRWLATIWAQTATEHLGQFTGDDYRTDERINLLALAIGEVLVRLNEHTPPEPPATT